MSSLSIILFTNIEKRNIFDQYFPLDFNEQNLITEVLLISKSFKNLNKGSLKCNNKIYYYNTYIPNSENRDKIFILMCCGDKYPKIYIDKLTYELFTVLDRAYNFKSKFSSEMKRTINQIFYKYQHLSLHSTNIQVNKPVSKLNEIKELEDVKSNKIEDNIDNIENQNKINIYDSNMIDNTINTNNKDNTIRDSNVNSIIVRESNAINMYSENELGLSPSNTSKLNSKMDNYSFDNYEDKMEEYKERKITSSNKNYKNMKNYLKGNNNTIEEKNSSDIFKNDDSLDATDLTSFFLLEKDPFKTKIKQWRKVKILFFIICLILGVFTFLVIPIVVHLQNK